MNDDQPDIDAHDFYDDMKVNEEDEKAIAMFSGNNHGMKSKKLSDLILEKIAEKQKEINTQLSDCGSLKIEEVDDRYLILNLPHYRDLL